MFGFLFPCFSVFLAIFHVLPREFLIFHDCQFSRQIPGSTVCVSHFPRFLGFSPYPICYSGHFSFFKFFSASRHIPGHTVFVSHFPRLSVFSPKSRFYCVYFSYFMFSLFLTIFQVLQCVFLLLHVFQCFSSYFMSYYVSFSFSSFFSFLSIFLVLP